MLFRTLLIMLRKKRINMNDVNRCGWCQDNGMMQKYHDEEWGVPLHDDKKAV